MLSGENGECHNVANPQTYSSILDMAELVANIIANKTIKVYIKKEDIQKFGYANTLYMKLNIDKLKALGWLPKINLVTMFKRMIQANEKIN